MKSGWLCGLLIGWAGSVLAQNKPDSLVSVNDSVVTLLRQQLRLAQYDTTRIKLLGKLATRYQQEGKPDSAFVLLQDGLQIAYRTKRTLDLGRIQYQLGLYYDYQVLYPQSINAYRRAIPLLQQARQVGEATEAMYALARVYTGHGYSLNAVKQVTENLAYANQTGFYRKVGAAYSLLYEIHTGLDEDASAFADLQAMLRVAHKYNYPGDLWLAHGNLAEWYEKQHQYSKAYLHWRKSLSVAHQLRKPTVLVEIYCGLANNLIEQNRLSEVEAFLDNALQEAKKDKRIALDHPNRVLARLRERQNRLPEAYQITAQILAYARKNYPYIVRESLETLLRIQKKQGNYREALATLQELKTLSDSLRELKKVRAISAIESRLALEKQKKDIALLKKNVAIQKLEMERTRQQQINSGLITLGLAILLVLMIWFDWQTRLNVRKLNQQKNEIFTQAEHLQELNSLKDKLFLLIGHDLRGPVMSLKSSLNKLGLTQLPPDQFANYADRLKRIVDTLYSTLDNLLHWSALQREGLLTKPEVVDLAALVAESMELLETAALQKNITVDIEPGSANAWADENQAQIVIRNILHNAIKFTPLGGRIQISFHQLASETTVSIADSGAGMATTDLQQATQTLSRVGTMGETGTGLGLLVCDEFMKCNGGRMKISSQVGKGTVVQLSFVVEERSPVSIF